MKSLFVIYGLLLAVFLIMVVISPTYRSAENIGNIIVQCVPLAVVSLGQTVVMIGGGIDMSVGSLISLSTCIAAVVMILLALPRAGKHPGVQLAVGKQNAKRIAYLAWGAVPMLLGLSDCVMA